MLLDAWTLRASESRRSPPVQRRAPQRGGAAPAV